jgi:hypothetical protein
MNLLSFYDELEKIAVSLADLQKLTKIVKGRSMKLPEVVSPATITPQNVEAHLKVLQAIGGENAVSAAKKVYQHTMGKIVLPRKGDFLRAMEKHPAVRGMHGIEPQFVKPIEALKKNPEARRALEGIVKGHELEELAKAPRGFAGPHAAGVLPVEHNILATLPETAKPAGDFMRNLRKAVGENEIFEAATMRPGGKSLVYGEGPRLSRHAVKRVGERMKQITEDRLRELNMKLGL